jgi:hypothetical protein
MMLEGAFCCMYCEKRLLPDHFDIFWRRFPMCPSCGNKRCPRATHHDNVCTGSNEPGQPGSAYE